MTLHDFTATGLMLLLVWVPLELTAAQLIATNYLDNERVITNYVLDNPFLKVVVNPDKGGGIGKIVFKKAGVDLTDGLSFVDQLYHHFPDNGRTIEEYESLGKSRFTVVNIDDKQKYKRVSLSGTTTHFLNPFRLPISKIYDYTLELYWMTNLYGSITMPIIIGAVATNIVIKPLDPIKGGEPCLKPFKILSKDMNIIYRIINDTNSDAFEAP